MDAIGLLRNPKLAMPPSVHARIEFKYLVAAMNPIDHYFDAIDVLICWKVGGLGPVYEESSSGDTIGMLRRRAKSILPANMDTHEIVYDSSGRQRIIPVLQIGVLFAAPKKKKVKNIG